MNESQTDWQTLIRDLVDYVLPELTPSEFQAYVFLLRNSHVAGTESVRIGKKTIASRLGRAVRGSGVTNYEQVSKILHQLESKNCLSIRDTSRLGTLYMVMIPEQIPWVATRKFALLPPPSADDFFTDPERRMKIFARDGWTCQYCGESVTTESATLDHVIPQSRDGTHSKSNLRTACLLCNSIKSGKSLEEAAPLLMQATQARRTRTRAQAQEQDRARDGASP